MWPQEGDISGFECTITWDGDIVDIGDFMGINENISACAVFFFCLRRTLGGGGFRELSLQSDNSKVGGCRGKE